MSKRTREWLGGVPKAGPAAAAGKDAKDIRVTYEGREYKAVFRPSAGIEQSDGSLWFSGKPSIDLADAVTGEPVFGLTVDIPEVALKPNQVLVCGRREGPKALEAAGIVQCTGKWIRSHKYGATVAVCDLLVDVPIEPPFVMRGHLQAPEKAKEGRKM